jgi:hypothetical protein
MRSQVAKDIDILEKKIKLIQDNYGIFTLILFDLLNYTTNNILDIYKEELSKKNEERKKETKQIGIEDQINEMLKEKEERDGTKETTNQTGAAENS